MDEAVKIPLSLDNSSLLGQVRQAGDIIKAGLAAAGSGAKDAFDPFKAAVQEIRGELSGMSERARALEKELTQIKPPPGLAQGFRESGSAAGDLINKLGGVVLAYVSIANATRLVGAAFKEADNIQDVTRSLETFTGSTERAVVALRFFDEAQNHTRSTGMELAKLYTEILPLGVARGWGQVKLQEITLQLSQLAVKAGQTPDAMIAGFNRLLAGGAAGAGGNPLLTAIGLDSNQVRDILKTGGDLGAELARRISESAGDVPDSWESALKKIKDTILTNLGRGVMDSFGQGSQAMENFKNAFTDPAFLKGLETIGELIGKAAIRVGELVSAIGKLAGKLSEPPPPDNSLGGTIERILIKGLGYSAPGQIAKWIAEAGTAKDSAVPPAPSYDDSYTNPARQFAGYRPPPDGGVGRAGRELADAAAKSAEEIAKAKKAATEAQLAFDKLFAEPQSDPLLKALQEAQEQAHALDEKFQEVEQSLKATLLKEDLSAGARVSIQATIKKYEELRAAIAGSEAEKEAALADNFIEKQAAKEQKGLDDARRSFDDFVEAQMRGFGEVKDGFGEIGTSDFGSQALGDGLRQLKTQLDAALEDARRWSRDETGELSLTPEEAAAIKATHESLGRDLKAGLSNIYAQLHDVAQAGVAKIFEDMALTGDKDLTGVLPKIDASILASAKAAAPAIQELFRDLGLEIDFDTALKQAISASKPDLIKAYQEASKQSAAAYADAVERVAGTAAALFTAGVEGGAEGFANAASSLFLKNVNEGAKGVFKSLALLAFGAPPKESDFPKTAQGAADFAAASAESAQQAQQLATVFEGVVGAIGQTMRIFQQAKQGQAPSILGTTLSFAATGASIGTAINAGMGTIIGAAVGAIVGAIIGILASAKAKAEQVFATYGIRGGQPYVEAAPGQERQFENLSAATRQEMLDTIRKTWESTTNDFIKLIGRFGKDIADGVQTEITKANFTPQIDASKMGIKNFMADFQYWVEHGLVQGTIGEFRAPLLQGFEALGLSAERFAKIWTRLSTIDPTQAIDRWNELYDALKAFEQIELQLSPDQYGVTVGLFTQARADAAKAFADQLAAADFNLVQMGDTMSKAIGPEQITMAKEWGDALLQRQQAVKQFFQEVAAAIDGVIAGYQSKIRDLTLAGMKTAEGGPDVEAQVSYLKKYADSLWTQITQATTPEQVLRLSDELSTTISKIQQVGGAQSVEAAEAYRQWAIAQLTRAQDLVVTQLENLARDVAAQNAAFLDAIDGFIEAFRNATQIMTDIVTAKPGPDTGVDTPPPGDTAGHRGRPPGMAGDPWYGSPDHPLAPTRPELPNQNWQEGNESGWWGGYTGGLGGNPWMAFGANPGTPQPQAGESSVMMGAQWDRFTAQLVDFAGGRDAVSVQRFDAQNQLLAEIRDILAAGRDVRVSGGVDINIEGEEVFVPAEDGFVRRDINARGRR